MLRSKLVVVTVVAVAVILLGGLSVAQDRVEVFGGYSYINNDFSLSSQGGMQGWTAAGTLELAHHVGVTADFSGFYPNAKVYTLLFGPQVSIRINRITPFAHLLFGEAIVHHNGYLTSDSSFSYGLGGGADFNLTRRFALRGQVDWLHTKFQTFDSQGGSVFYPNVVRLSTGIVARF